MTEQAEVSVEQDDTTGGGVPHAQSTALENGPDEGLTEEQEDLTEPKEQVEDSAQEENYIQEPDLSEVEGRPDADGGVLEWELQVADAIIQEESVGQEPPSVATDQVSNVGNALLTDEQSLQTNELLPEATEGAKDELQAPEVHQESLLKDLREVLAEQERSKLTNAQLQHRIAEYLSRKKTEEQGDPGRSTADLEKRYLQCLVSLDIIHSELQSAERNFQTNEEQMVQQRDEMLAQVQRAVQEFMEYRKEKSRGAVYSRTGRKLSSQEVDNYQTVESAKEQEVIQARVENFKLLNKIQKLEALLKEKDQLAEGLHMIDFEQLKINNVDLNEKIEERNEDIIKLKQKVTSTVQVLTHIKEKLHFLEAENKEKRSKLLAVEVQVANKRDLLTRSKQARDALRADNAQLKQRGGLVGHKTLLRDYEDKKDETDELQKRMQGLQEQYTDLIATCERIKTRIAQTT